MKIHMVMLAATIATLPTIAIAQDTREPEIVPGLNGYALSIDANTGNIQCQVPPARYADRYIFFRDLREQRRGELLKAKMMVMLANGGDYQQFDAQRRLDEAYQAADLKCDKAQQPKPRPNVRTARRRP